MKHAAFLPAVLALLVSCRKVEKFALPPEAPPSLDELQGSYAVDWVGADLFGVAQVVGDTLTLQPYPCRPTGTADGIGGTFEYSPDDGTFAAVEKSLDGVARLEVSGSFAGASFRGTYQVLVLGEPCNGGTLTMERTESAAVSEERCRVRAR